jgi:cell wall-associated NlpC family hydrolase
VASVALADLKPADVLVVRSTDVFGTLIELGDKLAGLPDYSHVAVVHHTDPAGTIWCIEGRPGGVGWRTANTYLSSTLTISNTDQPIAPEIRASICTEMRKMLGTPYDWDGIAGDALRDLHLPLLWSEKWGPRGLPPAQVVCSSFAAWLYAHFGLRYPSTSVMAHVEPADWAVFIESRAWLTPPSAGDAR